MHIETELSDKVNRYLDLATAQVKITAANMANVDTPGYKTIGMDFEAEMRNAIKDVNNDQPNEQVHVGLIDGLISRPDGNNVSMDHESMKMAEAQLKFKTGVSMLRSEYQRVLNAIHVTEK